MDTKKFRGQGQVPRSKDTEASVLKKKSLQNFFRAISKKMDLKNFFQAKKVFKKIFRRSPREENKKGIRKFYVRFLAFFNKILMVQKIMLSSSRGQGNF